MYVDRIVYPVHTLGPGNRIAIWMAGCSRRCPHCSNPELWDVRSYQHINNDRLADIIEKVIEKESVDGITITGGEPFEQAEALLSLTSRIENRVSDILVYSGYTEIEIRSDANMCAVLTHIAVLIDGDYQHEKNDGRYVLAGSTNQRLVILNSQIESVYREYLDAGRKVENVFYNGTILSIGIHNR